MTTQEQTAQHTPGPMEAWAVAHGVSIDARASATAFTRAVSLNDLLAFAREQDAIRADLLMVAEGWRAQETGHPLRCAFVKSLSARAEDCDCGLRKLRAATADVIAAARGEPR